MDVLSDVLRNVRMTGGFFFDAVNYAPWVCGEPTVAEIGHRVMPGHQFIIPFHVVLHGSCWVELPAAPEINLRMNAGDIVVLPKGDAHFMVSTPGSRTHIDPAFFDPPPGRRQLLRYIVNGEAGGPVDCHFVCGFIGCDLRPFNPLIGSLPRVFTARSTAANRDWLANLAAAGVGESERDGAGAEIMLAKLADLMFVEVVRQYATDPANQLAGWLSGLRDRQIGHALQLIHGRHNEDWTLDRLASEVGISRSVFSERFTRLVGMPAIQYLARWRLTLATRLLEDAAVSVAQAGAEAGYESEAAFHRAFKKYVGVAPGSWRREHGSRPNQTKEVH